MATNPTSVTPQDYLSLSMRQIEVFEGRVPYLYLDPEKNITVGVGQMLPNLAAALELPFQINDQTGTHPASEQQIIDSWNRLEGMAAGKIASAYYWPGAVFLTGDEIDQLLLKVIYALDAGMPSVYATYPNWPTPAKLAILDCAYNLGIVKLAHEYTHLNSSLRSIPPDFIAASKECGRNISNPAFERRNVWTENQFILAAQIDQNV